MMVSQQNLPKIISLFTADNGKEMKIIQTNLITILPFNTADNGKEI